MENFLNAPLILASNGAFVQTHHLFKQKPLFINDEEVRKIISYTQAIKFIAENSNEVTTITQILYIFYTEFGENMDGKQI